MTDEQIVNLYWQREESAISESAGKYGSYCHAIARNILFSREDSEECVNDTWLRCWNSIPPHRPSVLRSFLGKITRNLAINRWEKARAEKRGGGEITVVLEEISDLASSIGNPDELPERLSLTACLNRFLESEKEESRKIFVGRYWYLRSIKELAGEYALTESGVKMSLLRARGRLKKHLMEEGFFL